MTNGRTSLRVPGAAWRPAAALLAVVSLVLGVVLSATRPAAAAAPNYTVTFDAALVAASQVGDTVSGAFTIAVGTGDGNLTGITAAIGAGTVGFDSFSVGAIADITAGTSTTGIAFTARLTGAPGSTANHLTVAVTGTQSAASHTKTSGASSDVTSNHAVTATLGVDKTSVNVSSDLLYTLTFKNDSDSAATITSGLTAPTGTTAKVGGLTDVTSIAANDASEVATLGVDVNDDQPDNGTITATPVPKYTILGTEYTVPLTPTSVTTTVTNAVLDVTHTLVDANAALLRIGDVVNVTVVVENTGHADATSVVVANALTNLSNATAFKIGNANCGGCSLASSSLGTIAAGQTKTLKFNATVAAAPTSATASNVATVTYVGGGSVPTEAASPIADTKSLTIALADVEITVTGNPATSPLVAGVAALKYDVVVKNNGAASLESAQFSVAYPAGLTPVASTLGLGCPLVPGASPIVCDIPSALASGASVSGSLTFTTGTTGAKTITGTIVTSQPGQASTATGNDTSSGTVTVESPIAALRLAGSAPATANAQDPGSNTTPEYTASFSVTNPVGPQAGENVKVAVSLVSTPTTVAFGTPTGCASVTNVTATSFDCTLGTVAVGATSTFSFPVNAGPDAAAVTYTIRGVLSATSLGTPFDGSPADISTRVDPQVTDLGFGAAQVGSVTFQTGPNLSSQFGTVEAIITNYGSFPSRGFPGVRIQINGATGLVAPNSGVLSAAGCDDTTTANYITCTSDEVLGAPGDLTFNIPVISIAAANATPSTDLEIVVGTTPETLGGGTGVKPNVKTITTRLNRAPLAVADVAPVLINPGTLTMRVLNNDTDAEQQSVVLAPDAGPSTLGFTLTSVKLASDSSNVTGGTTSYADGKLTFSPPPGTKGDVVITYVVTDANGGSSAPATLTVPVRAMRAAYSADPAIDPLTELPAFTTPTATPATLDLTSTSADASPVPSVTHLSNGVTGLVLTTVQGGTVNQNASNAKAATAIVDGTADTSAKVVTYTPVAAFTSDPIVTTPPTAPKVDSFGYTAVAPGITLSSGVQVRVLNANPDICKVFTAQTGTDIPLDINLLPDAAAASITDANGDAISVVPTSLGAPVPDTQAPCPEPVPAADATSAKAKASSVSLVSSKVTTVLSASVNDLAKSALTPGTPFEIKDESDPSKTVGTVNFKADPSSCQSPPPSPEAAGCIVTFTPSQGYFGPANFTYTVADSRGGSAVRVVQMTVLNSFPEFFGETVTVLKNKKGVLLDVTGQKDANGQAIIISAAGPAAHGTLQNTGTVLTYFPNAGYVGPDEVQYTVIDGSGGAATAKVSIIVVDDPSAGGSAAGVGGSLPATGANATTQSTLAVVLLALGALALGVGSRRRRLDTDVSKHLRG